MIEYLLAGLISMAVGYGVLRLRAWRQRHAYRKFCSHPFALGSSLLLPAPNDVRWARVANYDEREGGMVVELVCDGVALTRKYAGEGGVRVGRYQLRECDYPQLTPYIRATVRIFDERKMEKVADQLQENLERAAQEQMRRLLDG